MEKGAKLKKKYELIIIGMIFFSILIGLIIAANNNVQVLTVDGTTSFTAKEDQIFAFNITVNNSHAYNITKLNITIDSTFAFKAGTNGTSASTNIQGGNINISFTNTTTILKWVNATALILGDSANATFWFNATPSEAGTYSFTIVTSNNTGIVNSSTISVIVLESHNVMTPAGSTNFTVINEDTETIFNITINSTIPVSDGNITNITITFPSSFNFTANSNGTADTSVVGGSMNTTFTNTSTSITWVNSSAFGLVTDAVNASFWFNLSAQTPGNYNIKVTTINSQNGGIVNIQNLTLSVKDITNPETPVYNCSKTRFTEGENPGGCSCTATDNYDSSPTISYGGLVTTNAGTYTTTCTATDDAGNSASSSSITYVVDASGGDFSSGGGGTTYTNTYVEDTKEFSEVKIVSKQLKTNEKIRIMVNSAKHNIGVTVLTTSTATIEIFSIPQTSTLSIGDIRKFDLTSDGYYDLSITLNNIANSKADLTLNSIYEEITKETDAVEKAEEKSAQRTAEKETGLMPETKTNVLVWMITIVIIILILVGINYWIKNTKKKKK